MCITEICFKIFQINTKIYTLLRLKIVMKILLKMYLLYQSSLLMYYRSGDQKAIVTSWYLHKQLNIIAIRSLQPAL
jgi:hypothetical protein